MIEHEGARAIWTMKESIEITSHNPPSTNIIEMVYDFSDNPESPCRFVLQWRDGSSETQPDVFIWKAPYTKNGMNLQIGQTAICKREHGGQQRVWMKLHPKDAPLPEDKEGYSYIYILRPE